MRKLIGGKLARMYRVNLLVGVCIFLVEDLRNDLCYTSTSSGRAYDVYSAIEAGVAPVVLHHMMGVNCENVV